MNENVYKELVEQQQRKTDVLNCILDTLRILHGTTKELAQALKPKG
jgi:hypothetical protein